MKPPLSREAIVRTAHDLLEREGLEGMSLRKVAAALDTGAASLYAYVDGQRELQTLVLDRALASVDTAGHPRAPWRDRLIGVLISYFHALARSPGLAQLAMRTIPVGPSGLRIIEALLTLLEEAGVDPATAAWAVDILALYVTGGAVEQSLRRDLPDPLASITEVFGTLSPAQYPRIHAARAELVSGAGTERFMWAVSVLVDGILHNPRGEVPSAPARRRRPPAR